MKSENLKIWLGFIVICTIWGSTWLVIRMGLDSLTPVLSAGIRFFLASIILYVIMRISQIKLQLDPLAIKLYIFMGLFSYVLPFALVYWAELYIATGLTSVLFTTFPFLVILFSKLVLPEYEIGFFKVFGTIIGFTGIYYIFSDDISMDFDEDIWAMLAVLLSSALQSATVVVIKKYGKPLNPFTMNLIPVFLAALIMVPAGFLFEDTSMLKFDLNALFSVSYLALFGTVVTFTTYYWLLQRMDMVILSLNTFVSPIIAIFLGWFILSENFTANDIIGSILALSGLLIANTKGLLKYFKSKKAIA